jgi:drug/metabolite transporter (DMT)-like permease
LEDRPGTDREPSVEKRQAMDRSDSTSGHLAGLAWMAVGSVLFALMNFFARMASAHASWTLVATVRALVGASVAFGVARARSAPLFVKDRRGIWLRSAFGTAAMLATFYALGSPAIALGDVATLANLTPVLVAILAPFFLGERAGRRMAVALPLCIVGVVLILHPPLLYGGGPPRSGASYVAGAVALSAAGFTASAMILLRRMGPHEGAEAISLHFSLVAAATCAILSIPSLARPSSRGVGWMLAAGIAGGLAQLAMTRAYALERAARVSGMAYLGVVATAGLGAAFLGEQPTPAALGGMALVIAGGLVVTFAGIRSGN